MSETGESVEVPFVKFGDRRGLTMEQVLDQPWLMEFVRAFPDSFEVSPHARAVLFIEPEDHKNGGMTSNIND
jgi:hypothetical protein